MRDWESGSFASNEIETKAKTTMMSSKFLFVIVFILFHISTGYHSLVHKGFQKTILLPATNLVSCSTRLSHTSCLKPTVSQHSVTPLAALPPSQEDQDVGPATKNITFPTRADPRSIGLVLGGQGVILLFTIVTSAIFNLDPLNIPSLDFSLPSIAFGVGVGTVMAGLGAVFDRIPWDVSQKLLRDTKVYTLMLLGRKTSKLSALGLSFLMSSAAGITEELLFRGVLLTWLHSLIGLEASVAISSALFGLAHVASFGAGSVVESVLGALFGISFIASGWNIVVPILAHTVYDAWTLFFTWLEASNQLEVYLQTNKRLVDYQQAVRSRASGNNEAEYIDHVIAAVFKIIDSNEDGVIVEKEIFQAFKLLGLDWNPFPQSKGSSVTLADRAHLALQEMDTNRDGTVSYEEFAAAMRRAYNLASELSNNQNSLDNKPNT